MTATVFKSDGITITGESSFSSTLTVTGAITATGGVVGAVTGDVTGNVVGGVKETSAAISADGAITITTASKSYFITKGTAAAVTIVDPTATTHDGVRITVVATTAAAHTLSNAAGSGFNAGGAASDVGTFGGAIGDNIVIEAYQGKWYVVSKVNVTLA